MTIHQRLLACIASLLASPTLWAHEFWIEPSTHRAGSHQEIQLLFKVGQDFRGAAQPYLPGDIERFEHLTLDTTTAITGLLGDSRPAARIQATPGLNQVIHHTTPFEIVFAEGDSRWEAYVALDGLADQLATHPNLPQTPPLRERYVRSAKSLILADSSTLSDRLTGRLPYELVFEGTATPGTQAVRLFAGAEPLAGILVKAFRHSDQAVVDQRITDAEGRVLLTLPSADRYLISGVVITPDPHPEFDWLSHWPALTFELFE